MKKVIAGFIVGVLIGTAISSYALTREEIFRRFGPKIIEAVVLVIKDEINILRAEHGLAARTNNS